MNVYSIEATGNYAYYHLVVAAPNGLVACDVAKRFVGEDYAVDTDVTLLPLTQHTGERPVILASFHHGC